MTTRAPRLHSGLPGGFGFALGFQLCRLSSLLEVERCAGSGVWACRLKRLGGFAASWILGVDGFSAPPRHPLLSCLVSQAQHFGGRAATATKRNESPE